MKCNKCGTPIIPGEEVCRICGNKIEGNTTPTTEEIIDFPETTPKQEEIMEIIDMPTVEPQPEEIIDIPEPVIKEQESKLNPEIEQPQKPIEPEKKIEEQPKPIKPQPVKKVEAKEKIKIPINVPLLVAIALLLISGILNVYLVVKKGNAEAGNNNKPNNGITYQPAVLDDYVINMPSGWIIEKREKQFMLYDETMDWAASIQFIKDVSFNTFIDNKDAFPETMFTKKYQFTSNYPKEVNGKQFYLYKGKYYNYSVYVIVMKLDDNNVVSIDLKFRGEVRDILLNNLLETITTLTDNNYPLLFKDNFNFKPIDSEIAGVGAKKE